MSGVTPSPSCGGCRPGRRRMPGTGFTLRASLLSSGTPSYRPSGSTVVPWRTPGGTSSPAGRYPREASPGSHPGRMGLSRRAEHLRAGGHRLCEKRLFFLFHSPPLRIFRQAGRYVPASPPDHRAGAGAGNNHSGGAHRVSRTLPEAAPFSGGKGSGLGLFGRRGPPLRRSAEKIPDKKRRGCEGIFGPFREGARGFQGKTAPPGVISGGAFSFSPRGRP